MELSELVDAVVLSEVKQSRKWLLMKDEGEKEWFLVHCPVCRRSFIAYGNVATCLTNAQLSIMKTHLHGHTVPELMGAVL
jgi:hypothetical protein